MKPLPLLLVSLLFVQQASAQLPSVNYNLVSLTGGLLYFRHPGKNVSQSFPYTIIPDAGGNSTSHTFNGSLGHSFANPAYTGDIGSIELARKHHSIVLGIGISQEIKDVAGIYFKGGYRYLFPLKGFLLKTGFDLYLVSDGGNKLGSIDNKDQEIDLFGYQAKSQWTESSTDDQGVTTTDTYHAKTLHVIYRRKSFLAEPKIAIVTTGKHLALGLEAGWMFQLSQSASIRLEQSDTKDSHGNTIGTLPLNNNGSLGGPYIAITVGVYFWRKTKRPSNKPGFFDFRKYKKAPANPVKSLRSE